MTDIVLKDIDTVLADRIRRVAEARGWSEHEALERLIEHGLFVCEGEITGGFEDKEVAALSQAIAELKLIPPGPGFANR